MDFRLLLRCFSLSIITLVFFWPQQVSAAEPPTLKTPEDNSVISDKSPKLIWEYSGECPDSGSCYRIEIDNSVDFSSPEKSIYSKSASYSPQSLIEGNWNWRVKAKDKSEKWSAWSSAFKFTIGNQHSHSPPANQPVQASNNETSKPSSSFEIKDSPSEINSDQEFEIPILLLLPKNGNQVFYTKAAFKKDGSSNYFGETFNGNEWVKNGLGYSKQFKIQTDSQGKWEGKIKIRPDEEDSGFEGSGDYILKLGRYSDSGSGPSWSNELNLKINQVDKPEPLPSEEHEIEEVDPVEDFEITKPKPSRDYEIKIASVAGEATMSNNIIPEEEQTLVLEERKVNWLLIILGIGVVAGNIGYVFYKIRKKKV